MEEAVRVLAEIRTLLLHQGNLKGGFLPSLARPGGLRVDFLSKGTLASCPLAVVH